MGLVHLIGVFLPDYSITEPFARVIRREDDGEGELAKSMMPSIGLVCFFGVVMTEECKEVVVVKSNFVFRILFRKWFAPVAKMANCSVSGTCSPQNLFNICRETYQIGGNIPHARRKSSWIRSIFLNTNIALFVQTDHQK